MSKQRSYQELVGDHRGLLQFSRRLSIASGCMQFSLLIFTNAWKHLELPFYKVGAPILFAWCLYQFGKDFFKFLKADVYGSQIIANGISLENQNASHGKYFYNVLEDFNFIKILSQRSLVNFLAFGCLGYFLSQFIVDFNPNFALSRGWVAVIAAFLTTIACTFYYAYLKPIEETKLLEAKVVRR